MNADIDNAIRELTGVGFREIEAERRRKVFAYGQLIRTSPDKFTIEFRLGKQRRVVTIPTSLVKRYREGDSHDFVVEMTTMQAEIMQITDLLLSSDDAAKVLARCQIYSGFSQE